MLALVMSVGLLSSTANASRIIQIHFEAMLGMTGHSATLCYCDFPAPVLCQLWKLGELADPLSLRTAFAFDRHVQPP
jgi:hypothetical protein